MKIVLTNDDGVISQGIQIMARMLADRGWLAAVVAPDRQRSGQGHAVTVDRPVRTTPLDPGMFAPGIPAYSCDGTPTDCVTIGLEALFPSADFVVSGINQGPNVGDDVTYSGTVCAAMEGVIMGRSSVAVSLCCSSEDSFRHFTTAALSAMAVIEYVEQHPLPELSLLNVNVPNVLPKSLKGYKITRRGGRRYQDKLTHAKDPKGNDCYWISGSILDDHEDGSDVTAVNEGYVSVTPIQMDMTNYAMLDDMRVSGVDALFGRALKPA
jgi:5'-nucleotidase